MFTKKTSGTRAAVEGYLHPLRLYIIISKIARLSAEGLNDFFCQPAKWDIMFASFTLYGTLTYKTSDDYLQALEDDQLE